MQAAPAETVNAAEIQNFPWRPEKVALKSDIRIDNHNYYMPSVYRCVGDMRIFYNAISWKKCL